MTFDTKHIPEIADEYVLGLLDPADHAAVDAEIERNAALRAAVAAAQERFLPLDATAAPSTAPADLWSRIEAGLTGPDAEKTLGGATLTPPVAAPVKAGSAPANDNRRSGWRTSAIASMAASLLLAVALTWSLGRQVEPVVIAVLLDESGGVQAVVEDFGNDNAQIRLLADLTVPQDKAIEVWTLPSQDMGPVSLGLLEGGSSRMLEGPPLPEPKDAQLYEITLEQAGGSPTGRPTGPILAKGFARMPR